MKKLFWIGTFPDYQPSIGDHAQTLAVQKIFAEQFSDFEVERFSVDEACKFLDCILGPDDLVFLHSGGGFGDLYREYHELRKRIITHCGCNRVVQLPVSVHYGDACVFECDKIFFSDKPNVLILCRSQKDAALLSSNFGCHVAYWPDFVYSLKPKPSGVARDGVLLVLRSDHESLVRNLVCRGLKRFSRRPFRLISKVVRKDLYFVFCRLVRWLDWNLTVFKLRIVYLGCLTVKDVQVHSGNIDDVNRERIIYDTFRFYEKFKLVVTDRFHGLIFAHMAGAETIALPTRIRNKTLNIIHPDPNEYFPYFRAFINKEFNMQIKTEQPTVNVNGDLLEVIRTRRSIRKWSMKPVSLNVKELVLEAGAYAPSACNTQSVRLISVDNPELIAKLCQHVNDWFKNSFPRWVIVVCVDLGKAKCKPEWMSRFVWQDSACAMQNMMLVAEGAGLGTCWVSVPPLEQVKVREVLGLTSNLMVACLLFVGYSGQQVCYEGAVHMGKPVKRCLAEIIVSNVFSDSLTAIKRAKTEGKQ